MGATTLLEQSARVTSRFWAEQAGEQVMQLEGRCFNKLPSRVMSAHVADGVFVQILMRG